MSSVYMYLAADPHLKIFCSRDPQKQRFELHKCALKYVIKDLHKYVDIQKIIYYKDIQI